MAMQRTIEADLDASPERVYTALSELDSYPEWLDLVRAVHPAPAVDGDAGPAWFVTLRAAVGPFARSKRLRMVRVVADAPTTLRFERTEHDGRHHSPWTLDVVVGPGDDAGRSRVHVSLAYGGGLWSAPLEGVLAAQVDTAVPKLARYIAG